eukprot:CAMPEP_0175143960 /NCGR_PEP_ID=MMETSP0087-20121206/13812_1 /TAXON_ID=136419 /ORGANISM="Unknown Unknown, Strain D1" /LENGTH=507 /DNA_ID=CAMNT_0016428267 /DNA_START=48 /DNA_END=1569 /DNA_ORIENTATION=+
MANVVMNSGATAAMASVNTKSKLDPYCRFTLGKKKVETIPVDKGGGTVELDPVKHKSIVNLPVTTKAFPSGSTIELKMDVMDDAPGPDLFIGTVTIDLRKFFSEDVKESCTEKGSSRFEKPDACRNIDIHDPKSGHITGTAFATISFKDSKNNDLPPTEFGSTDGIVEVRVYTLESLKDPNVSTVPQHSNTTLLVCAAIFLGYLGFGGLAYSYIGIKSEDLIIDGVAVLDASGSAVSECKGGLSFLQALYFVITTLSTIGYGDFFPCTTTGRVITFFFIFIGLAAVTSALTIIAEYFQSKADDNALAQLDQDDTDNISEEQWAVIYAVVQYVIMLVIGAVFIMRDTKGTGAVLTGDMNFADGMYWSMVTSSTVGYGDISAQTDAGRVFQYFYMLASILITARTIGVIISAALAGKQKRDRLKALAAGVGSKNDLQAIKDNSREMNLLDKNMSEEDQKEKVTKLEYLAYFLMKLGNCDKEHIEEVLQQFERIDADGSGTLEAEDSKTD